MGDSLFSKDGFSQPRMSTCLTVKLPQLPSTPPESQCASRASRFECNPPHDSSTAIQAGFDGLLARLDNIAREAMCHVHAEMLVGFSDTVNDLAKQKVREERICQSWDLPGVASSGLPVPGKPDETAFETPVEMNSAETWAPPLMECPV